MKRLFFLLLLFFLGIGPCLAQQPPSLNQAFASGQFEACVDLSTEMLDSDATDATANFFKGACLGRLKAYDRAIPFLKKSLEHGYPSTIAIQANLLRSYAGLQHTDQVLDLLKTMLEQRFAGQALLSGDEFAYLGSHKPYQTLLSQVEQNANPCQYAEAYKRLDFWLGVWDVHVGGTKIADSTIRKSAGGCTLFEEYNTLRGFTGTSTNYYDPVDSLYKQIWIDKFNSISNYVEAESREGYLQMIASQGNGSLIRMTYEYDREQDTVTQQVEVSTDNGTTWNPNFLGVYKRNESKQKMG